MSISIVSLSRNKLLIWNLSYKSPRARMFLKSIVFLVKFGNPDQQILSRINCESSCIAQRLWTRWSSRRRRRRAGWNGGFWWWISSRWGWCPRVARCTTSALRASPWWRTSTRSASRCRPWRRSTSSRRATRRCRSWSTTSVIRREPPTRSPTCTSPKVFVAVDLVLPPSLRINVSSISQRQIRTVWIVCPTRGLIRVVSKGISVEIEKKPDKRVSAERKRGVGQRGGRVHGLVESAFPRWRFRSNATTTIYVSCARDSHADCISVARGLCLKLNLCPAWD